jgi:hypothetical protein
MRLIRTHDGLLGWDFNNGQGVKWCSSLAKIKAQGLIHWDFDPIEYSHFCKDVERAVEHLAMTGDTVAHFGMFGCFMYSSRETESELDF